nr:hypothetical protein [Microtetraspora fusca]
MVAERLGGDLDVEAQRAAGAQLLQPSAGGGLRAPGGRRQLAETGPAVLSEYAQQGAVLAAQIDLVLVRGSRAWPTWTG